MRINPVLFATSLVTMLVAHNVADHVVQTDHQAANKARPAADAQDPPLASAQAKAMAGHVGGYQFTQAVALAVVLPAAGLRPRLVGLLAGTVFSATTHALIDRRWPVTAILRRTRSPRFAELQAPINGPYVADQALHHGCLLLAALMIAAKR